MTVETALDWCPTCADWTASVNRGTDLDPDFWCVRCEARPFVWSDYDDPLAEQTSFEDYRDRCDQLEDQLNREIG